MIELVLNNSLELIIIKSLVENYIETLQSLERTTGLDEENQEYLSNAKNIWLTILYMLDEEENEIEEENN